MDSDKAQDAAVPLQNLPDNYYRILIDNISDHAIIFLNPKGIIITCNASTNQILQYSSEEIIRKHFSAFYTSEANASDFPAMELREARRLGKFEDEGWRVRKDGTLFWANVIITPVYGKENVLIGFTKIVRDLSERKKAEDDLYKVYQEVKESEMRFRLLIKGVTDYAIYMLDPVGNVTSWNDGAHRLKGYQAHEIIGKYYSRFFNKEAIEQGLPEQALLKARTEGHYVNEGWRYRKDGSAFWANTVLTAIYSESKELLGFSKITRDLTEKKKMEQQLFQMNEELKESEEKNRLLVDSIKDYAILMLNPEGIVSSWNIGAERIKGYKADEIIGKHFSAFYTREAVDQRYPQFELKKALEVGHFEDEGWRIRKDGTAFWANVIITPIYNTSERLLGFAKITRDLTERRRNEQVLLQRNRELAKTIKELDNFVYTASHELKSPIANLEGLLTVLEEEMGEEKNKHTDLLAMMEGAVTSLKNVVHNLADVNRLQQEKDEQENINLQVLLEEVQESMHDLIAKSGAKVDTDFTSFRYISYSRENLRIILYNLLSNALLNAHPDRKPVVIVRANCLVSGECMISIADNGKGIAAKNIGNVFSMFKRGQEHGQEQVMSLFIVHKILEDSGDTIEVESEEGKGTEFKIYFKQETA